MKAIWKGLIVGIVLIIIGAAIIITTFAINGWSAKSPKFSIETYTAQKDYTSVKIDIGASTVKTQFYDGEKIEITYPVSRGYRSEITERDGTLKFENYIKWYAQLFHFSDAPETVIKLPKDKIFNLDIDVGAGLVTLAEGVYGNVTIDVSAGKLEANGIACDKINCDVSAGKLDIKALTCPDIKADVSAGRLEMNVVGAKSDYTIHASVSAGSCNISNQTGTTDKRLAVDCSAGSIEITFSN